jgi:hypothetical protein
MNFHNGTISEFYERYQAEPTEPEEGTTMKYEAISIYSMSLRPDHNTANSPLGAAPAQARMQGDELWISGTTEKWLKVLTVNGQPPRKLDGTLITVPVWVAIVSAGRVYCSLNEVTPPPVEPELPSRFALSLDGVNFKWYVAE